MGQTQGPGTPPHQSPDWAPVRSWGTLVAGLIVLGFNTLMLISMVQALNAHACGAETNYDCGGQGFVVLIGGFLWFVGDLILLPIWGLAWRFRRRRCPGCLAITTVNICPHCAFDYTTRVYSDT